MKKKHLIVLLGLIAAVSLTACGSTDKKTETEAAKSETEAIETELAEVTLDEAELAEVVADDEELSDEEEVIELDDDAMVEFPEEDSETEAVLEPVTPSDYLIKDVDQYVKLGDLKGLEATKYTYEITDDMIEESIQYDLDMYSEEVDVDRASKTDDIVYLDLTSSIQGSEEEPFTESTYFTIGYEEYGLEFDEKLTGVKAGDQLEFSITFGDEIWVEEWIGQTVDFTAEVTAVSEISVPEYDETFVKEYTDYETIEEYEASIRDSLVAEYEEISYTDTIEALLEAAVSQSEFTSYPQEIYDSCKAEILSFYAAFAGTSEEAEIYEMFGITEDDIKADVEYYVYRRLLVSALCEQNNIELTQDDYFAYLEENAPYYEYESAADFEADYTRETLIWSLYESMVADILYESAVITEEPYEEDILAEELYEEATEEYLVEE